MRLLAAAFWTGQIQDILDFEFVPAINAFARSRSADNLDAGPFGRRAGGKRLEIETERVFAFVHQRADLDMERCDPLGVMLGGLVEREPEHVLNDTHFVHTLVLSRDSFRALESNSSDGRLIITAPLGFAKTSM